MDDSKEDSTYRTMMSPLVLLVLLVTCHIVSPEESPIQKTSLACEDYHLQLNCSLGEVVRIVRAHYGRFSLSVCNKHGQTDGWKIDCHLMAKDKISERCDGRRSCTVLVNSEVFTDPCPGTYKYAEVKYTCEKEVYQAPSPAPTNVRMGALLPSWNDPHTTPKPPYINSMVALNSTSIQINWTVEVPVITVAVYWTPVNVSNPKTVFVTLDGKTRQTGSTSFVLNGLKPNTTYAIFLKPFLKNTNGPPTHTVNVTTLPDENQNDNSRIQVRLNSHNAQNISGISLSNGSLDSSLSSNVSRNEGTKMGSSREIVRNITLLKQPALVAKKINDKRLEAMGNDMSTSSRLQEFVQKEEVEIFRKPNTSVSRHSEMYNNYNQKTNLRAMNYTSLHEYWRYLLSLWSGTNNSMSTTKSPITDLSTARLSTTSTVPTAVLPGSDEGSQSTFIPDEYSYSTSNPSLTVNAEQSKLSNHESTYESPHGNTTTHKPHTGRVFPLFTIKPEPVDHRKTTAKKYFPATASTRTTTLSVSTHKSPSPTLTPGLGWITPDEERPPPDIIQDIDRRVCPREAKHGLAWPEIGFGQRYEQLCPGKLNGIAAWTCTELGWESSGPDISNCYSQWLRDIQILVDDLDRHRVVPMQSRLGKGNVDVIMSNLNEKVMEEEVIPGDIKRTILSIIPKLLQEFKEEVDLETPINRPIRMKMFRRGYVSVGSNLLKEKHVKSWKSLTKQDRQKAATSLLLSIENFGFESARFIEVGSREREVASNVVVEVERVDSSKIKEDVTFPARNPPESRKIEDDRMFLTSRGYGPGIEWAEITDTITIPSVNLQMEAGVTDIVFTLFKNLEDLIPPQLNIVTPLSHEINSHFNSGTIRDNNKANTAPQLVVNSNVISASINGTRQRRKLHRPVQFTLHHKTVVHNAVPICSFWNIDISSSTGKWASDGCNVVDTNTTHTTCSCNHLTNFALLMDVTGVKLSEESELALRVITYVGCIISIVCLLLSWITFMVFKNLQCDRNTIHKNLVLCLLLAEIVFLAGIAQTEPKFLCSLIAGSLHYLFLGAFAWMCLEGVQLYVMLIEVFEQERSRLIWYYLFGYGVPAVIVSISAGIYHQGYGTDRHCWLTTERSFIWAFVGPALAVMLVNIVMLGIAIYVMCRHTNMSANTKERSKVTKFSAWLKGAMVLVVLLGLTWLLGVLYLNKESEIIAYLFTILNSLQGMFIFIFHCIKNEKVQKEYRKVARRTAWLPNCIRVNYGGYNGVASSSPIPSTGSGNYLSRLFGPGKRKRSEVSTNSSAKPFLSQADNHRQSDVEFSSSRDASSAPVSLNGYVYTPGFTSTQYPVISQSSLKGAPNRMLAPPSQLAPCCETDCAGELSEYLDCSVVDSEFVSEYCRHNMQVSMEQKRYSTESEDSQIVPNSHNLKPLDNDNLSTLSMASSSRKPSSLVSSLAGSEQKLVLNNFPREGATSDPKLNLNQYIIPTSKKVQTNNLIVNAAGEPRSASMNKLTKPAASLSSIPESEHSPQHSSTPNIQFSPDRGGRSRREPVSDYEELSPSSTIDSPSSIQSSLPNLDMLTIDCEHGDHDCNRRRHSSETEIQFSPFRFTATEC
ncbi:adhesion G protein-coupled receptor L3-like isoform X5 [Biomphalaria glabrata]|uniref:Adhesion G protein-coupled receptor L3-like isoform X5 n=1 Tax=Biomphalaria glabrata TaxID=6526 RepID=A0A9W3AGI7_BIOGL|nr:adhesion G protein-coupled receptor L3-like isoform X5 [Biomphalaria glabrata]